MRIRLLAFATAAQAVGASESEVEVARGATVGELRDALTARHPGLGPLWERMAVAVDGELAGAERELEDGQEVALLPPVSGGSGRARTALVDAAIDVERLRREVGDPSCGAVVLFLGTARDHLGERRVERLVYEAYRRMAATALEAIAAGLEAETAGLRLGIVHRLGDVPLGEASVAIAAASPHREAAFAACRTALERLKREVPIWKLETYADGSTVWREEEALPAPARRAPR